MKKLLILLSIICIAFFSCNTTPITVVSVTPFQNIERVPVTSTTVKTGPNNKAVGTAVGVGVGELLIGGPIGWIIGGSIGHSAASDGTQTTITYKNDTTIKYRVILSDGRHFTSENSEEYIAGQNYTY